MTSLGSVRNISNYLHPLRFALYIDLRVRAGGRGVVRGCVFHRGLGSYLEVRIIHSHKVFTVVPLTPFFPKPGRNWSSFPPPASSTHLWYVRNDCISDLCKLTGYDRDVRDSRFAKP